MPRKLSLIIVASVIASVIAWLVMRGGEHDTSSSGSASVTNESASAASGSASSRSSSSPSPAPSSSSSPAPSSSSSPPTAPAIPPEAMPQLAEALAAGQMADVVQLCASATARAAHVADCTIAACREHLEAKARSWFASVAEADQPRVTQACDQARVTVTKPVRIRPHRHRRGDED